MVYDGSVFLHFLNRELLRSLNIQSVDHLSITLNVASLITTGQLYAGLGIVIENSELLFQCRPLITRLIQSGHLELISDKPTLDEYIVSRQHLYANDTSRYPLYFNPDSFTRSLNPSVYKNISATGALEYNLLQICEAGDTPFSDAYEKTALLVQRKRIMQRVLTREEQGITISLFGADFSVESKYVIGRLLSGLYLEHYLCFIDGDICTGIRNLDYYDRYSRRFPVIDIALYVTVLDALGLRNRIDDGFIDYFVLVRGDENHRLFCTSLQCLVGGIYSNLKINNTTLSVNWIRSKMQNTIRQCANEMGFKNLSIDKKDYFAIAIERSNKLISYCQNNGYIRREPYNIGNNSTNQDYSRYLIGDEAKFYLPNISTKAVDILSQSQIICMNNSGEVPCKGIMDIHVGAYETCYVCRTNSNHRYLK